MKVAPQTFLLALSALAAAASEAGVAPPQPAAPWVPAPIRASTFPSRFLGSGTAQGFPFVSFLP